MVVVLMYHKSWYVRVRTCMPYTHARAFYIVHMHMHIPMRILSPANLTGCYSRTQPQFHLQDIYIIMDQMDTDLHQIIRSKQVAMCGGWGGSG